MDLLAAEGVKFVNNAEVGKNVDAQQLLQDNDAVLLAVGSTCPRNIPLPGKVLLVLNAIFLSVIPSSEQRREGNEHVSVVQLYINVYQYEATESIYTPSRAPLPPPPPLPFEL